MEVDVLKTDVRPEDFLVAAIRRIRRKPTPVMVKKGGQCGVHFHVLYELACNVFPSENVISALNSLLEQGVLFAKGEIDCGVVGGPGEQVRWSFSPFRKKSLAKVLTPYTLAHHNLHGWVIKGDGSFQAWDEVSPGQHQIVSRVELFVVEDGLPNDATLRKKLSSKSLAEDILTSLKKG